MKKVPSRVDDELDGDVQNAGDRVVDELYRMTVAWHRDPRRRPASGRPSAASGVGDVLAVARTLASVDFPPQHRPSRSD